ncbi:hypothetical protein PFISCL1PPCAC_11311, partial [Pristionchus fissidentatus]
AACPSGFELVRNGDCHKQLNHVPDLYPPNAPPYSKAACEELGAQPVIIRNQEDHDFWYSIAKQDMAKGGEGNIMLGIECNLTKYQWMDGSNIDFKPSGTDMGLITR